MLQVASALKGYAIQAEDGKIGTVDDFLFDDRTWTVRWLVVDTGSWLTGRLVLVHPSAIKPTNDRHEELLVALTKAQVKDSPDIASDRPVSRQAEASLYGYYGYDPLWGASIYGAAVTPLSPMALHSGAALRGAEQGEFGSDNRDLHLRSIAAVTGYHVHGTDGGIGHVENFIIDSAGWGIPYLVVDTSNWWFGQHVLISPLAVNKVEWTDRHVRLDITREQVKTSPPWNPAEMIHQAFQERLHNHYGWPGYGW